MQLESNGGSWEKRREGQIFFSNKKWLRSVLCLQLAATWGTELNSSWLWQPVGVTGYNLGHSGWPLERLSTITTHPVLRVEQSCTGHQRWDGWISGAHEASAVQSHCQCDLILVITQLQGQSWTGDPRGPFVNTSQGTSDFITRREPAI